MAGSGLSGSQVEEALRGLHGTMTRLFGVEFPLFKEVALLEASEVRRLLTERIRAGIEVRGDARAASQWMRVLEGAKGTAWLLENMAFYDGEADTLCVSRNLLTNSREAVLRVLAHELAEKLFATLARTLPPAASRGDAPRRSRRAGEDDWATQEGPLARYRDAAFKAVFREGLCEAIALRTLSESGLGEAAARMEEELLRGHAAWSHLLLELERTYDWLREGANDTYVRPDAGGGEAAEERIMSEILRKTQAIKAVSYHLGYPLAKMLLEGRGTQGVEAALRYPPTGAGHFIHPEIYISYLNEERR